MKRFIYSLAVIFALLPLSAAADSPIRPEIGVPIKTYQPVKPMVVPGVATVAPVEEISVPAPQPAPAAPVQPTGMTYSGCGDNWYANFIYMHESGCNTWNPNPSSGACGLGQAWPCSKLESACPNMDYVCENAWFNNYAAGKGGWEASYNYWVSHGNW